MRLSHSGLFGLTCGFVLCAAIMVWPSAQGYAQQQGGGAFKKKAKPIKPQSKTRKPVRSKKAVSKRSLPRNYDGTYLLRASRTERKNFVILCPKSYRGRVVIRNGRMSLRLLTGRVLSGRVQGARLPFSSTADKRGGRYFGSVTLPSAKGATGRGAMRYRGKGRRCAYQLTVTRR